ncbi:MAG: aminoacetone oxidase family FAD-binding enzyme [Bacteroidaceae bacterium]|nr:aminoacetone oxidase family FAD-binding enzyme [Bacteroidaceae bacterium]
MTHTLKTAIVGGGAAGFFLAINLREMCPEMQVTIMERSGHLLQKVRVSGGGRCNCSNTFEDVSDLSAVYPRGHRLMKRLMKGFSQRDAFAWFESHGVPLTVQPDHCVFPESQDSQTIIDCFMHYAHRLGITISTSQGVDSLETLGDYDYIAVTVGGLPRDVSSHWLSSHPIEPPVPSLFTFSVDDNALHDLMGTVVETATALIPGTRFRASGPLLITHWGMSGPSILKLSSYAARYLAEKGYKAPLAINWISAPEDDARRELTSLAGTFPQKFITSVRPFGLPSRLWNYIATRCAVDQKHMSELSKKDFNRLVAALTSDSYEIASRAPFKDEFVTCGGISLASVNSSTLESRLRPRLYFAGEVLDIDGITGGFNFQAAWTTSYTVARSIADSCGLGLNKI